MEDYEKIAAVAHALSDPIRVEMLQMLSRQDDICACHFQTALGLSQSKASYHLRILVDTGVIRRESRGTWSHYSLGDPKGLRRLLAALRIGGAAVVDPEKD
jgi:ArsR family transcriptional regulator, arsenate/arsenite/antimonite-responsive transcriptional repressor